MHRVIFAESEEFCRRLSHLGHASGELPPDWEFRLPAYDTCGNVNEWCRDWVHERLPGGVEPDLYEAKGEPSGDGTYPRARRGGCYADPGWACRSGFRQRFEPERRHEHIGLRVVAVRL